MIDGILLSFTNGDFFREGLDYHRLRLSDTPETLKAATHLLPGTASENDWTLRAWVAPAG